MVTTTSSHKDPDGSTSSPAIPFIPSGRCYANWFITAYCNYRCHYCTNRHTDRPTETWDIHGILRTLSATGKKWCLGFTGGEPFMFPGFTALCATAIQNDFTLYIATNLSPERPVREFIDTINPAMVENMAIALHIEEREKRNGVSPFLKTLEQLRNRNFPFEVQYVMHPQLFPRFKADREFFLREGIALLPKPFQGVYAGRLYPDSYRKNEQEIIIAADPDAFRRGFFYARGVLCNAGHSLVQINPNGTISRCVGERTLLGSCETSLELFPEARPCKAPFCACFGWDLIADEQFRTKMKSRLCNSGPPWIQARRYLGAFKRKIQETARR